MRKRTSVDLCGFDWPDGPPVYFRRLRDADEFPDRHAEPDGRDHQSCQADPVARPHGRRIPGLDHRKGKSDVHLVPRRYGPGCRTPGPAQAAQRNYLQALHAEVAEKGVYVGMLYIGAAIKNSAFHAEMEKDKAAGNPVWEMPAVDPEHLADLLWTMHSTKGQREAIYP